jgi:ubiquinone/menaquinone biosynthesis C-methylase UbiE
MDKYSWGKTATISNCERDLNMKTFYNSNNLYFEQIDTHDAKYYGKYIDLLKPVEGGISLDVGCGTGFVTIELAKQGYNGYGIDISNIGIKKARKKAEQLRINNLAKFEVVERSFPFVNDFFDVVGACSVFEHLSSPEEILNEMIRVVKPGGYIIIISPNFLSPFHNMDEPIKESQKMISTDFVFNVVKNLLTKDACRKFLVIIKKIYLGNDELYFYDRQLSMEIKGGDKDAIFYSNPLDLKKVMVSNNVFINELYTFGSSPKHIFRILSMLPIVRYMGTGCRIIGCKKQ